MFEFVTKLVDISFANFLKVSLIISLYFLTAFNLLNSQNLTLTEVVLLSIGLTSFMLTYYFFIIDLIVDIIVEGLIESFDNTKSKAVIEVEKSGNDRYFNFHLKASEYAFLIKFFNLYTLFTILVYLKINFVLTILITLAVHLLINYKLRTSEIEKKFELIYKDYIKGNFVKK
jgi:hypothetical protein